MISTPLFMTRGQSALLQQWIPGIPPLFFTASDVSFRSRSASSGLIPRYVEDPKADRTGSSMKTMILSQKGFSVSICHFIFAFRIRRDISRNSSSKYTSLPVLSFSPSVNVSGPVTCPLRILKCRSLNCFYECPKPPRITFGNRQR